MAQLFMSPSKSKTIQAIISCSALTSTNFSTQIKVFSFLRESSQQSTWQASLTMALLPN